MSGLTDAISQAEQKVLGNPSNITQQVGLNVNSAITGVVNTGVRSAQAIAGNLLQGNLSGAAGVLGDLGASIANGTALSLSGPGSTLAGALSRPDPMLSFCWYAQMPTITPTNTAGSPSSLSTLVSGAIGGVAGNIAGGAVNAAAGLLSSSLGGSVFSASSAMTLPWSYVETATLPFRTIQTKAIFREGRDRFYPDKYSIDALRLGIYADSSNIAIQYLQAWNNALIAPFAANNAATQGGSWGRPVNYKKTIYIYLVDVTQQVLASVQYVECWPTNIDSYQLNSDSSTRIVNEVTFSVGDVFVNLMPVSSSIISSIIQNPGSLGAIAKGVSSAANGIASLL